MSISNSDLAQSLEDFAELLVLQGGNPYRIKAYRKAAKVICQLPIELASMVRSGQNLTKLPAIGSNIAGLIKEIIEKEDLSLLQNKDSVRKTPLTINSIAILPKRKYSYRFHNVLPIVEHFELQLRANPNVVSAVTVGQYRRKCELINDITILVDTNQHNKVIEQITYFIHIKSITKIKHMYYLVKLNSGLSLNLVFIKHVQFPTALLYLTGSPEHIDQLEDLAVKKNIKLTSSGLYKNRKRIICDSENDIYSALSLDYIPPELREDHGEIKKALSHTLPNLITLDDIRGDLHTHTDETDGIEKLETMVEEAIKLGYEYIAITDHTQSLKITNGLDEKRLWQQIRLIDKLNKRFKDITILKSTEVDILEDGTLDLPDSILKELDIRICAIHSKFRIPEQKQTERILKAMDNRYFNILAHPTGRLIKKREPYEIDMDKILSAAKERNCFLEINAQPYRLDINEYYARQAKRLGVKISIATDAHSKIGFTYMQFGVNQARRGWLEAKDVINTLSLNELLKIIKR